MSSNERPPANPKPMGGGSGERIRPLRGKERRRWKKVALMSFLALAVAAGAYVGKREYGIHVEAERIRQLQADKEKKREVLKEYYKRIKRERDGFEQEVASKNRFQRLTQAPQIRYQREQMLARHAAEKPKGGDPLEELRDGLCAKNPSNECFRALGAALKDVSDLFLQNNAGVDVLVLRKGASSGLLCYFGVDVLGTSESTASLKKIIQYGLKAKSSPAAKVLQDTLRNSYTKRMKGARIESASSEVIEAYLNGQLELARDFLGACGSATMTGISGAQIGGVVDTAQLKISEIFGNIALAASEKLVSGTPEEKKEAADLAAALSQIIFESIRLGELHKAK